MTKCGYYITVFNLVTNNSSTSKFSGLSGLSGACYGVLRMCKIHGR